MTDPTIYIHGRKVPSGFAISIESLQIIQVYQTCKPADVILKILPKQIERAYVTIDLSSFETIAVAPEITSHCEWPVLVSGRKLIGGLCAVSRSIAKYSKRFDLLGFRRSCVTSCSESSSWTKFCEIDAPLSVNSWLGGVAETPLSVARFEYHMKQPVRAHNIGKMKHDAGMEIEHLYAEGNSMTLCDVLLYPCFQIFFRSYLNNFPLTKEWIERVGNNLDDLKFNVRDIDKIIEKDHVVTESLYKTTVNENGTDQTKIDRLLNIVSELKIVNDPNQYGNEVDFDWKEVPRELNPMVNGLVPYSRGVRKSQQLEGLLRPVMKLAGTKRLIIVDFCSGSGHLGLLIAHCLPNCHVILVENKKRSLSRAEAQIDRLQLNNVTLIQSNVDYFVTKFDVGVALHACGTATDLVLRMCIQNRAHFVCCPCCYGGIRNCHVLDYPRSEAFRQLNIPYDEYASLAHAADQTHVEDNLKTRQGYVCMDVIDWDRKLYANSMGYEVILSKLNPVTCSLKNNLLIGISSFTKCLDNIEC